MLMCASPRRAPSTQQSVRATTDKDCVWHHGPQGAFCTTPQFNTCPDLDIAFVLDGSGSMRRSFGRHPHGFYGLMEILREWMKTVPLTG